MFKFIVLLKSVYDFSHIIVELEMSRSTLLPDFDRIIQPKKIMSDFVGLSERSSISSPLACSCRFRPFEVEISTLQSEETVGILEARDPISPSKKGSVKPARRGEGNSYVRDGLSR